MKNQFIKKSWILALAIFAATGCSDDDNPAPEVTLEGQILVAGVSGEATYLLSTSLETIENPDAVLTNVNNGLEYNNTFTFWIPNAYEGIVALKYGQGNAHVGQRFTINSSGAPALIGAEFELQNGMITAGLVGDYVYTLMSGNRATYDQTKATMNRVPMSDGTPQFQLFPVNEFAGYEGMNAALIGIADAGDGNSFYTSLNFWEDATVNDAIVAKINTNTLATEAVYTDSRLGISGGFMQSARFSHVGPAGNGDVYVFSSNNNGTKKAGALVIRSGANGFDQSYYWDIESVAGYRIRKIFHVKDNKFLLEFYNTAYAAGEATETSGTFISGHYAIADMSTKSLTWISGLPDKEIIRPGNNGLSDPYLFDNKLYIGISSTEENRFYTVDYNTGAAIKGARFDGVTSIRAITFVERN
ncbi:DUF4374 domain-containing protein [Olivibacter sitiensis]|uniref:DUF4374 domain-containing protein n=1 Tax=Olivibacter sitiensis TaxID=376470 RepID=UPI00040F15DA|nr:DUF4374 domain-containing protein [Olivibacter sitiensis]